MADIKGNNQQSNQSGSNRINRSNQSNSDVSNQDQFDTDLDQDMNQGQQDLSRRSTPNTGSGTKQGGV